MNTWVASPSLRHCHPFGIITGVAELLCILADEDYLRRTGDHTMVILALVLPKAFYGLIKTRKTFGRKFMFTVWKKSHSSVMENYGFVVKE